MKHFRIFPLFFLSFLFLFPLFAKNNEEELQKIALLTSNVLMKQHFVKLEPSQENSIRFFDEYLRTLDPQHIFFTKKDIEEWRGVSPYLFGHIINGRFDFAFLPFQLYRKRLNEYAAFVRKQNLKESDFKTSETFVFDRTKAQWPETESDMQALWMKKFKNDVLTVMLHEKIKKQEASKNAAAQNNASAKPKALSAWDKRTPVEKVRKRVEQTVANINDLEKLDVLEMYLNAFSSLYDPHTSYMAPRTEEDFNIQMRLSLVGIGAVLTSEDGYTKIVQIMPGGPADLDGRLKPDDRIISVQQESAEPVDIMDMPLTKVVTMIRGKLGTKVTLTILEHAKGAAAVPMNITLVRNKVVLKESEVKGDVRDHRMPDGRKLRIGVISVPSFYLDFEAMLRGEKNYKSSTGDMKNLIAKFSEKKPLDALIVDLRSNGGGSLFEAINMTGLFIKSGPVVQIKGNDGSLEIKNDEDSSISYAGPMLVLTNRYSASASEIFAAALKDYRRAVLVGDQKTHGKGTVQVMKDLSDYVSFLGDSFPAGSLKMTSSKFYRINGESTQRKGVEPDIAFPSFTDTMEIGEERLPNALSWDVLPPARYMKFSSKLEAFLPELSRRSKARMNHDKDFVLLRKDIALYDRYRKRTELSLNFETRWKEYLDEKNLADEQLKLLNLGTQEEKSKNKKKDLYLEESFRIAADLIQMNHRGPNVFAERAKKQ